MNEHDERGLSPKHRRLHTDSEVSPVEARTALQDTCEQSRPVVLDVRLESERDVAAINTLTVHIPLHELEDRLDELEEFAERPILVLCHHGVRSLKAALMIQSLGYEQAKSIAGGIEAWSIAIDPQVPRYTRNGAQCSVIC